MKVHLKNSGLQFRNAVVTLGTFDGVHLGHRAVLTHLKNKAVEIGGESVAITFSQHPRDFLAEGKTSVQLLNTFDEKVALIGELGIDNLVVLGFDRDLSLMGPCEFVEKILAGNIGAKHIVMGFNHHFGRKGAGDYETIKGCAGQFGLSVELIGEITTSSISISSSSIRDAILEGRVEDAGKMLGYSYNFSGRVVVGRKLGRTIGFPTINIDPSSKEKIIPAKGVYAVSILTGGRKYKGMMNIGNNPTVDADNRKLSVEVNIFDFSGDIYGEEVRVFTQFRLRDEKVFENLTELTVQLEKDKMKALELLS